MRAIEEALFAKLLATAKGARKNAYAPYSGFHVGAAIATASGRIFAGCNVENASFGATICAERNAVAQMIAEGEREPVACVVVTAGTEPWPPCGMCRQVLVEFARDMPIALVGESEQGDARRDVRLAELLPDAFVFPTGRGAGA